MRIKKFHKFFEDLQERPIINYDVYNKGMAMSYDDKLYFLDKVDADVIVDFGCANGFILEKIREANPNIALIGYDLDQEMLNRAKLVVGDDVLLTTNWNEVIEELKKYKSPLLLLSSVIHEVYSYSHTKIVKKFWDSQVFGENFKWIVIRDMMPDITMENFTSFNEDVQKVREKSNPKILESFEKRWGSIGSNYRTFVHYLLKYRYIENWEREVNENYLPLTVETFKKKIKSNWAITYEKEFLLPFIVEQVKKDFDIDIKCKTHAKFILKNLKFRTSY